MPSQRKRSESPSVVIPSAGAIPSIFDLSSLPSDTPRGKVTGTGHGGDDLSLSDLSVIDARAPATEDAPRNQWDDEDDDYEPAPFRLLNESPAPRRVAPDPEPDEQEPEEEEEGEGDMTMSQLGAGPRRANETIIDDDEREMSIHTPQRSTRSMVDSPQLSHSRSRTAAERREEQLHAALFQLRKMNAVFGDYVGALEAVDANTERLERQVERTNAILDRYVKMLGQQEQITKLVLDEEWRGGEADEQIVQERIEELARQERERKEREERERREREEREREEAERAQAEQEARERAAKAAGTTRGRGVRGTATRGASTVRGRTSTTAGAGAATGAGRGTVARPPSAAAGSKIGRPSSVSSTRGAVPRARGRGGAA